jgi:dCTP deaminase
MPDETLLRQEIHHEAVNNGLLRPFDPDGLRGASYDLRVGRTVVIVNPENDGITPIDLEVKGTWDLPPGRAAILYSLERVRLPNDMKGRLSIRSRIATRLLNFPGGPIDPGYSGHLFLPLANLSDVPIAIEYGQPIVTVEFVRLGRETTPYPHQDLDSIPKERLPAPPPEPVFDLTKLTAAVVKLESEYEQLRISVEPLQGRVESTGRIVDWVMLAAVGGLGAGAVAGGILALATRLDSPWSAIVVAVGIGGGLLAIAAWIAASRRATAAT